MFGSNNGTFFSNRPSGWAQALASFGLVACLAACSSSASAFPSVSKSEMEVAQAVQDAGLVCEENEENMAMNPGLIFWDCEKKDLEHPFFYVVHQEANDFTLEEFCKYANDGTTNLDVIALMSQDFEVRSNSAVLASDLPDLDVVKINSDIKSVLTNIGESVGLQPKSPRELCNL